MSEKSMVVEIDGVKYIAVGDIIKHLNNIAQETLNDQSISPELRMAAWTTIQGVSIGMSAHL